MKRGNIPPITSERRRPHVDLVYAFSAYMVRLGGHGKAKTPPQITTPPRWDHSRRGFSMPSYALQSGRLCGSCTGSPTRRRQQPPTLTRARSGKYHPATAARRPAGTGGRITESPPAAQSRPAQITPGRAAFFYPLRLWKISSLGQNFGVRSKFSVSVKFLVLVKISAGGQILSSSTSSTITSAYLSSRAAGSTGSPSGVPGVRVTSCLSV